MKMKDKSHRHDINSLWSRHKVNIRIISVWWCLYVLSNTQATFEAQFMRKLSNAEADLKRKALVIKKACILLAPIMKAYLIHFLFRHEFEVVFAWIVKKSDFVDSEIVVWGLTSLTDFHKRVHLLFRKRHVSDCQKKICFDQITHLKFTYLTPCYIESYY